MDVSYYSPQHRKLSTSVSKKATSAILNNNMNVEFISGLMDKRKDRYEAVADITVATDGKNVTQICEEIISKLIALDNAKEAEA